MESGIEKCVMLIMKSGKWHRTEGIKLSNQEKEYLKRTRKILETKPCKILRTIIKVDEGRTLANRQENKKTHHYA